MPDLNVKLSVQISGGATIQGDRTIPVGTFQPMEFSLPPNRSGTAQIEVDFTSDDTEAINLLLIQSSLYTNRDGITYTISDQIKDLPLAQPVLLLGSELIAAIAQPKKMVFKNKYQWTDSKDDTMTKNTAKIVILVGREAPPPPKEEKKAEENNDTKSQAGNQPVAAS